jgi:hypothetical protein
MLGLLLLFVVASRLLCSEHYLLGYDPGNYWLAVDHYSIEAERPHPPGYPAYIGMVRAMESLTGDRHQAMLLLQILFSVGAVAGIYHLSKRWIGPGGGLVAALLLASNPTFWLYGSTSENYSFDALFGLAVIYALVAVRKRGWILAGFVVGFGAGVRPASIVLMLPVIIYLLGSRYRRDDLSAADFGFLCTGVLVGLACWLPAVVAAEGGAARWWHAATGVSASSAGTFIGNITGLVISFCWMLNASLVYLALRTARLVREWRAGGGRDGETGSRRRPGVPSPARTLAAWVVPQLLFFALVIYSKGYGLLLLPALCIGIAWLIGGERSQFGRWFITAILVAANCAIFLLAPYEEPPPYTMLAPRVRTVAERAGSVFGRALSVYLPSLSRIRAGDRQMAEGLAMITGATSHGMDTTLIILDPAAAALANARVLQTYLPGARFAQPGVYSDRPVSFYHGIDIDRRNGERGSLAAPRLLLLTSSGLVPRYAGLSATVISTGRYLTMLEVPPALHGALRKRIEELYVR